MSSRTKRPIVSDKPETPNLKTTADLYREMDQEIRDAEKNTKNKDGDLYRELKQEIRESEKVTENKKTELIDSIYGDGEKYLKEMERNKKPNIFKRLLRFFTG